MLAVGPVIVVDAGFPVPKRRLFIRFGTTAGETRCRCLSTETLRESRCHRVS